MSSTNDTVPNCAPEIAEALAPSRIALVQGLLGLAGFLEAHPEIPDPHVWAVVWSHSGGTDAFRPACEALLPLGATVADKRHDSAGREVCLTHTFGPIKLEIEASKSVIGEPVTAMREVTEHRLPDWAQAPAEATS